ncbi:hypothetical protein HA402_004831 [Bradysia odoriphaga]|nr:hypothetical protein HA402_004831 [Bradysia odoriphaga]
MSKTGKFYPIEEIVKQRTRKGNVEYFVKWKGYSSKSNSWVPASWFKELPKKERRPKKTTAKNVRQSTTSRISKANGRTTKKSTSKTALIALTAEISSQAGLIKGRKRKTKPETFDQTTPTTTAKKSTKAEPRSKKSEGFYEIERILGKRIVNSKVEFLVHWKGFSRDESSWEPEGPLKGDYVQVYCHSLRNAFLD